MLHSIDAIILPHFSVSTKGFFVTKPRTLSIFDNGDARVEISSRRNRK